MDPQNGEGCTCVFDAVNSAKCAYWDLAAKLKRLKVF